MADNYVIKRTLDYFKSLEDLRTAEALSPQHAMRY